MTIIYYKSNGKIKSVFSGDNQHLDTVYGDLSQDYMIICDEIIIPDDENVMINPQNYKVNTTTKELEILPSVVSQYPIATI